MQDMGLSMSKYYGEKGFVIGEVCGRLVSNMQQIEKQKITHLISDIT